MELPTPIDVNRLKGILGASKAIMNKVEAGDYESGHIDGRALSEEGVQEMMAEGVTRPQKSVGPNVNQNQPLYKNLNTSKMPDFIKDAMVKTPIPQASGPTHTFNLEDVQEEQAYDRTPKYPKNPKTTPNRQPVHESQVQVGANSNGSFTVSETALRSIVKDILLEFMANTFTQNLSEEVIKKTINTLIKEGKIGVKKKVVR